jgi:PAS domain S-box-containing protein
MRLYLPISLKVWTVVLVPLMIQIVFAAILSALLQRVELEKSEEMHAREVEAHTNALLRLLLTRGCTYVLAQLSRDSEILHSTNDQESKVVRSETDTIKQLLRRDPRKSEAFSVVELEYKAFRQGLINVNADFREGNALAAIAEGAKVRRLSDRLIAKLNQLLSEQQQIEEERRRLQEEYRSRVKIIVIAGLVLDAAMALAYTLAFNMGIARRLRLLLDNTVRLARGQQLTPVIKGNDEIARLDHTFRVMSASVAEMTGRERAVVEYAADVICSIDKNGLLLAVNPALSRICGYDADQLVGRPLVNIVVQGNVEATHAAMRQIVEERSDGQFENQLRHKAGSIVDMSWSVRWSEEEQSLFCVARDITRRKEVERLKRDFVAMVSHDLRTPIASLMMFLDGANSDIYGSLSQSSKQEIARAGKSAERLTALVNNVLDLEKIESTGLILQTRLAAIGPILEEALASVSVMAAKRSLRLEFTAAPDRYVEIDRERMMTVLITLLTNAIKLSEPGSTVAMQMDGLQVDQITISIFDRAEQVPEGAAESVFDRYSQGPAKGWQDAAIMIGLTICKAVIEKHGGKIGVQRNQSGGNRFWFSLPCRRQAEGIN